MDQGESSEVDIQKTSIRADSDEVRTLKQVAAALRRLEEGSYGECFEAVTKSRRHACARGPSRCAARIARKPRNGGARERMQAQKRGSSALFYDMQN